MTSPVITLWEYDPHSRSHVWSIRCMQVLQIRRVPFLESRYRGPICGPSKACSRVRSSGRAGQRKVGPEIRAVRPWQSQRLTSLAGEVLLALLDLREWSVREGASRGSERSGASGASGDSSSSLCTESLRCMCASQVTPNESVNTEVCSRWLAARGWERGPFRPLRDRSEVKWHTMRKSIFRGRRPLCFLEVATVCPLLSFSFSLTLSPFPLYLFLSHSFLLIPRVSSRFVNHRIIAPWDPIGGESPVCGRRDQWTATREITLLTVHSPIFLLADFAHFPFSFFDASNSAWIKFNAQTCFSFFRILRN